MIFTPYYAAENGQDYLQNEQVFWPKNCTILHLSSAAGVQKDPLKAWKEPGLSQPLVNRHWESVRGSKNGEEELDEKWEREKTFWRRWKADWGEKRRRRCKETNCWWRKEMGYSELHLLITINVAVTFPWSDEVSAEACVKLLQDSRSGF